MEGDGDIMKDSFEQTWWDDNLNKSDKFQEYLGWLGDKESDSRIFIKDFVKNFKISSIADFGCGPCVDYFSLRDDDYVFDYIGIDSCQHLKEYNESRGVNFLKSPVENTGLGDGSYELSYSRHVLEHQQSFKDCLSEMIRVAEKYAVHTFFIKPSEYEKIDYQKEDNLYHNQYCKYDIEDFLIDIERVSGFDWLDINESEISLIVTLKNGY